MAVRPLPMLWAHQNRTHRIGFALVRVRTPYPSFQMATQIGNIAQILDGAIDFYNKSPQEQGEALGKATVSVASDVAIAALTDGLGSVAGLRKAEKALEAADHAKDAERAAAAVSHRPALQHSGRGRNHLQPDAAAEGSHTTLRRNQDGGVSHHIEWTPNARNPSGFDEVKRVDTQHANPHSHRNKATGEEVMTPHTHEPTTPGGIRPARPDELPR